MKFKLDPPSGYADSYLDIEFTVTLDVPVEKAVVRIYNDTSGEQLDIIGVSSGYILNGNEIFIKKVTTVRGHVNLFNDDKMNKKFGSFNKVAVRCVVEKHGDSVKSEEKTILFYNESKSLDAEVIPVDVVIHNHEIDLGQNEALRVDVISERIKRHELCVRSADGLLHCPFEVSAQNGRVSVDIPGAFLYYDLELETHRLKTFHVYYVRYQGTNFSRLANRKYLRIPESEIKFKIPKGMSPDPQTRKGPTGKLYSGKFVVSDRYLVVCPREFSGLSGRSEFGPSKLMDLTMLVNEGQDMEALARQASLFAEGDETQAAIKNTERSMQAVRMKKEQAQRPRVSLSQIQLMSSVSGVYDAVSAKYSKTGGKIAGKVQTFANLGSRQLGQKHEKRDCEPCARKRRQNG